jgi:hypothetical protein
MVSIVRQKHEQFLFLSVEVSDASQLAEVVLFGVKILERNNLIALDTDGFVDRL